MTGHHDVPLRVALDATPLLGQRTGIGRYTEHLLGSLAVRDDVAVSATAFTLRGWRGLSAVLPAGVRARSMPVPARALREVWSHAELPPVGWFAGRCDVFHATNFVLPPTGRAAGVVTIHDLAFLMMPEVVDATSRQLRDLMPRCLRRAAVVCTPTAAIAAQIRDVYGSAAGDIQVTPLGVDPSWLVATAPSAAARTRLGLPERYFLFVGTREPRKDLATLLTAFRSLRAEHPDSPDLVLIGPAGWGPQEQPIPGVHVLGYLGLDDVQQAVAGAAALVMPSRYEGFGLPALEALATGTPVIVSSDPALREVTGEHATHFPIGDAAALADRLTGALDGAPDAQVRQQRRAYAATWTWDRCADATVAAYRRAAAAGTSG